MWFEHNVSHLVKYRRTDFDQAPNFNFARLVRIPFIKSRLSNILRSRKNADCGQHRRPCSTLRNPLKRLKHHTHLIVCLWHPVAQPSHEEFAIILRFHLRWRRFSRSDSPRRSKAISARLSVLISRARFHLSLPLFILSALDEAKIVHGTLLRS